ncbi:MAG: hypothetical protein OHK0022_57740 [Roseiflexaceae bacterium]
MTSIIKPMPVEDIDAFTTIATNAYPVIDLSKPDDRQAYIDRLSETQRNVPHVQLYGCYRDDVLVGGMRFFDFTMTMFETPLLVGGVGMVAVDLLHKKEHIAKDMIAAFLQHYRSRGATLTALYPFRTDFYRQMGFGYGSKMHRYVLRPSQLPPGDKRGLAFLTAEDKPAVLECYNRFAARTHGMIQRDAPIIDGLFGNREARIVGYRRDGQLRGYLAFQYRKGKTFIQNDIDVTELVYEDRAALAALIMFLRTQADQINQVIIHTQDPYFHQLPLDPRNGSENLMPHAYHESHASGVGLMYRVLDTAGLFRALAGHNFGGQTCRLRLTVVDSFLPENAGTLDLRFEGGRVSLDEGGEPDAALRLGVAELSSLVMGTVPFSRLYLYGQAEISDPALIPTVTRLFLAEEPPICMTRF